MLLQTIDPGFKSEAMKAYAMRSPFVSPVIGGRLLSSTNLLLVINYAALITVAMFLMGSITILIIARSFGYWNKKHDRLTR